MRRRLDFEAVSVLRRIMQDDGYDLAYVPEKRPLLNLLIAAHGKPLKVIAYRGIVGNLNAWNPEVRLTYLSSKVKRVVCVCEAVRRSLEKAGFDPRRLVTIYKGHDPAWYRPAPRSALAQFGIPADAFVVGSAAKMRPRKGFEVLLEAAARLSSRNIHFLLLGEIVDRRLPPLAAKLGVERFVHFAGFRRDAAELMGACDVFCMPSLRREGVPRALLEAMAQGVPPVVTTSGGLPEVVNNGESGLVVPPGVPNALAYAISVLADDPTFRRCAADAARARVATAFNIENTVRGYLDLIEQVEREV